MVASQQTLDRQRETRHDRAHSAEGHSTPRSTLSSAFSGGPSVISALLCLFGCSLDLCSPSPEKLSVCLLESERNILPAIACLERDCQLHHPATTGAGRCLLHSSAAAAAVFSSRACVHCCCVCLLAVSCARCVVASLRRVECTPLFPAALCTDAGFVSPLDSALLCCAVLC